MFTYSKKKYNIEFKKNFFKFGKNPKNKLKNFKQKNNESNNPYMILEPKGSNIKY